MIRHFIYDSWEALVEQIFMIEEYALNGVVRSLRAI